MLQIFEDREEVIERFWGAWGGYVKKWYGGDYKSSSELTTYQKDIVEQNLAQVFIWTGIHCFVSSVYWYRLCKTKYVTEVSGTNEIFAHMYN